ncbi:MAG: hypothetical protein DWQ02_27165, partial [Bacteroidetes bacterium]
MISVLGLLSLLLCSCQKETSPFTDPSGHLKVEFGLTMNQVPFYRVLHDAQVVVDTSLLGIIREDGNYFEDMTILEIFSPSLIEDSYQMNHGKRKDIKYEALRYTVHMENSEGK